MRGQDAVDAGAVVAVVAELVGEPRDIGPLANA